MGAVNDAVTDCIGDRGISDDFVPPVDGNLRDYERGASADPVLKDLQQTETARGIEGLKTQIIQDEELLFLDVGKLFQIASVCPTELQMLEQL